MVKPWNTALIGDFLDFKNGLNKEKEFFGYGTPIVNYTDVYKKRGLKKADIRGKVCLIPDEIRRFDVRKNDVFFTRTSETPDEVGMSAILLEDVENGVFSGFVLRGRPKNDMFVPEYCKYCFSTEAVRNAIITGCTYTTRALTNGKQLSAIELPVPPKPEQEAIAEALTDIDTLIVNLEKLIAKKKAIKQGAMQELLTGKLRLPGFKKEWTNKKLSELCDIEMGQSPDSRYYSSSEGVPLVQGNADIEDRQTIIRFFTKNITKKATKGDIIFTVRAPVGNVAHAMFDCCIGRGVCALQSGSDFLYHLLVFKQDMWSTVSSGSTFDSINSDTLCNTMLFVPVDEKEQIAIARILTDMDEEITILEKRLVKTKNIKAGMMSELLTGRIRLIDKEDV